MSGLKEKVVDYYKISNYMVCYKLMSGLEVSFRFEKVAFPHLIGLHKLVDIPLIQRYNDDQERMVSAKYLLAKIRQGKLLETDLRSSRYFSEIEERYNKFNAANLLSVSYSDVVVDFDVTRLKASKLVNTKYILFERESDAYRQLCIKQNAYDKKYYVESFFYEKSDDYIKGQRLEKVVQMKVVEPDGKIYLEDAFV